MSRTTALAAMNNATTAAPTEPAAAPVEGAPQTTEATPPSIDAQRLAKLARHEAMLQQQREAFKKERESFTPEKEKADLILKRAQEFEALKSKDPVEALRSLGFSEADLINFLTGAEPAELTPEQKAAQAAQAEIKKFQEELAKKEKEQLEARNKETVEAFRKRISQTVSANKEKFEFCAHEGPAAEQLIFDTVTACLKEDRKSDPNALPITPEEAAQMVENYYEEEFKAKMSLKKTKPNDPSATPSPEPEKKPVQSPRTLTNRVTATTGSTIPRAESHSEKRNRIIAQIKQHGITK